MNIAGAILAGGKNSRMQGKDKAFIKVDGQPIIERTTGLLKRTFEEVIIVTNSPSSYRAYDKECIIVTDIVKNKGPLGGMHAALTWTSKEAIFFVACDMPFLNEKLVGRLLDVWMDNPSESIVFRLNGRIQPLCGIYSKAILPVIEDALKKENLAISAMLDNCRCTYIEASDKDAFLFANINAGHDLGEVGAIWKSIL